jgi:hypothetical protein
MYQMISDRRRLVNFTRALLLCTSLTVIGIGATPALAASGDPSIAFLKKYNACDAQILANYWGVSFNDAKVTGGQKIQAGNNITLREVLGNARGQSECEWNDTGFNYDDAVALSKYWGNSTDQAKAKIVTFFSHGQSGLAKRVLKQARNS